MTMMMLYRHLPHRVSSSFINNHLKRTSWKSLFSTSNFNAPSSSVSSDVINVCSNLHNSVLTPLNDKLRGPLSNRDQGTSLPFVFCVGNHSSGKSSFINYVMGRKVQTAGVAPTDDTFTVIAPGPRDQDQDGPALIGDPDMGFANLRQFGPTLIHHTLLKVRSDVKNVDFMLVDSPGMIDSPASHGGMISSSSENRGMDRGYDFQGVVRWFAERADVVLLFFDPDKPGTTGETLSVLLHSLGGMDHKLLIVLNKADQFRKIHDFARAYGSLCWNLSKVIPRKDLPRIFTMCLPVGNENDSSSSAVSISSGLADLHQTREEVLAEVMKAPLRRIDNVITGLADSVHLLMMHATLMEYTRKQYSSAIWKHRVQIAGTFTTGASVAGMSIYTGMPLQVTASALCMTLLSMGGIQIIGMKSLRELKEELTSQDGLNRAFQHSYPREIAEADEFITSIWQRIREPMRLSLSAIGVENLVTVKSSEIDALKSILDENIPQLRRKASAEHYGTKKHDV